MFISSEIFFLYINQHSFCLYLIIILFSSEFYTCLWCILMKSIQHSLYSSMSFIYHNHFSFYFHVLKTNKKMCSSLSAFCIFMVVRKAAGAWVVSQRPDFLKKTKSIFPSSHRLPIALQLRVELHELSPSPRPCWDLDWLGHEQVLCVH